MARRPYPRGDPEPGHDARSLLALAFPASAACAGRPMRRIFLEWGSISSVGLFLATVALLVASLRPAWPANCLEVAHDRWGRGIVYLQVNDGTASLFSEPDFAEDGSARPYIADPRTIIAPKVTANRSLVLPG